MDGTSGLAESTLLSIQALLNKSRQRTIDLFRKVDSSGDGSLSRDEFVDGLSALGFSATADEFAALVAKLDKDGSGDITLKELDRAIKAADRQAKATARELALASGDAFDGQQTADPQTGDKSIAANGEKALAEQSAFLLNVSRHCPCGHVYEGFSLNAHKCPICGQKRGFTQAIPRTDRNKPLEPLEKDDEQLIRIVAVLNKNKVRIIDLFRFIDADGNHMISPDELRVAMRKLGLRFSDADIEAVFSRCDTEGKGELEAREFDRALKLVERKAHHEDRAKEVDTWVWKRARAARFSQKYDWSKRTVVLDNSTFGSSQLSFRFTDGLSLTSRSEGPGADWFDADPFAQTMNSLSGGSSGWLSARSSAQSTGSYFRRSHDLGTAPWRAAARGPAEVAMTATIGSGSVLDASTTRQRLPDVYAAPGARPRSLRRPLLPLHKTAFPQAVVTGRFSKEPSILPSDKMLYAADRCPTAKRPSEPPIHLHGGVRKFENAPTMQSTVDQVVFMRDMDMSGEHKFDVEFTQMYDGHFGKPSWHYGR